MVIVPAFNEEAAIGDVVRSVRAVLPDVPVMVIDDFSADATASVAQTAGARVVRLPVHLGVGGCVQTGYKNRLRTWFLSRDSGGWRWTA